MLLVVIYHMTILGQMAKHLLEILQGQTLLMDYFKEIFLLLLLMVKVVQLQTIKMLQSQLF